MEFHSHSSGEISFRRCGYEFRVITACKVSQGWHYTLHVHYHCFYSTCNHCKFLLKEVSCNRGPMAHQGFISRTANSGNIDSCCPFLFCEFKKFRVLRSLHNHFREDWFMPVDDHVYLVMGEHAEVYSTLLWFRCSEKDVLYLGCDHGTSPAVRETGPQPMQEYMSCIVIHSYMRPVHAFYNFSVNSSGLYSETCPEPEPCFGGTAGILYGPLLLSKFRKQGTGKFSCHFFMAFSL
ncbi:hypothetical protein DSECCO2_497400 [anaerobic digester metagenome]